MLNKPEKQVIKFQLDKEQQAIDDLERQYKRALRDIEEKIKLLQSDELTQSKVYQIQYQKALRGQVEGILDKLQGDEYATIQQYLHDSYQDGFIGTMYSVHGQGIPLILPIDQNAAVKAVITDSQISEGLYNHLGVNIKQLKRAIRQEITRGLAANMPLADIARNIANRSKAPMSRAKTIVRTEGHRIQQASANDAREAAKSNGCDVVKQWDGTLDGDTRPTHRRLDGQIRETDKPFEMDGKKAMYPGDFGKAEEDCNCRCVALTRAKWALDEDELKTLKERAKFFELDKADDFKSFEEKYLKADNSIKKDKDRQAEFAARREAYRAREAAKKAKTTIPDFNAMSAKEITQWADEHLQTAFTDVQGTNREYLAETAKAIATFEDKMGGRTLSGLKVRFGGTPNGVYAKYDDATNTILLKKTGSMKTFVENQVKANERYHRKWHTTKDYHATTTFSGTVFHELGHAVDIASGQRLSRALSANQYIDEASVRISVYAGSTQNVRVTRRSEAWAENFAAYMEGGAKAKEVPPEIVSMIEDYFAKK